MKIYTETTRKLCFLACLPADSRSATLLTPPRVTCPQWVWIPYINQKPRKCSTDMSTDQSYGSSSSVKVPSIQTTAVCVRLANTDQHSILATKFKANRHCHKPEKEWRPSNSGNYQRGQELPSYMELSVLALLAINFECTVHTEAGGNWHLVLTHDSFSILIETARPSGGEGGEANRFLK